MAKTLFIAFFLLGLLALGVVWWANRRVANRTSGLVFDKHEHLEARRAGLLLGTSKTLRSGHPNPYFTYRVQAAAALYEAGKIHKIVVSGDHGRKDYNEPQDMRDALMALGVRGQDIYLDYAGFRTYDSVYRMAAIFGQRQFTIVSQEFHTRRAVFIAQALGLDAVGYNAKDIDARQGLRTHLRERLAKVLVLFDTALKRPPKYLGDRIFIG